jgi:hypothetical protein
MGVIGRWKEPRRVGGKRVAALVPWFPGSLVPWCPGALVPWCPGALLAWLVVPWRLLDGRQLAQTRRNPPHNGSSQAGVLVDAWAGVQAGGVRALGLGLTACVLASSWRSGTLLLASCTSHPSLTRLRPGRSFNPRLPLQTLVPIARRPPLHA